MTRLAVPILILLLILFAGAVWAIVTYLDLPQMAGGPATESKPSVSEQQASPQPSEPPRAEAPATRDQQASFDVVRIDPEGTSVFAGRAEPGSTVTITGDGEAIGTAEADENGEWTFATEHRFASADPNLALSVKSAAQTKAEKAAKTQVAGRLETREAPKEPEQQPKRQTANSVASNLLKDFEGIVAAARTEAQEEQKKKEEAKTAVATGEMKEGAKATVPTEEKSQQTTVATEEKKEEARATVTTEKKLEEKKAVLPEPSTSVTVSEAKPVETAPMRLAATKPETPVARKSIPVPITFVFNEATFTDEGRRAAALLLEYLQLKRFPSVSLTGHADERGTEELNINLSKERLDTVEEFLREGGYKGKLDLIPKGESEPFTGVVRSQYSQEELYQFDRRVELIIAQ